MRLPEEVFLWRGGSHREQLGPLHSLEGEFELVGLGLREDELQALHLNLV